VIPDRVLVIGLGGNVGTDAAIVARFADVRDALAVYGRLRTSPIYRTAPVGGPPQRDFLNAALAIALDEPEPLPVELLATLHEIERELGRDRPREVRDGPRPIDLDVLVWGERVAHYDGLDVPHPRLAQRRFALAPLFDLVGDAAIPGAGATVSTLLAALDQRCELTDLTF
jgi:2-amino-4-hydroxy-6-hydroxymethyldihydropteridine diphosphokinase